VLLFQFQMPTPRTLVRGASEGCLYGDSNAVAWLQSQAACM